MQTGTAIAATLLAIVGGTSLWFAKELGRGRFDLVNGYKPEKVKDAKRLSRLMRICYSITGCALLAAAAMMAATRALMPWLPLSMLVAGICLGFMTFGASRHYKL